MKEIDQTTATKHRLALQLIARSVRKLWDSIHEGTYSSRSLVGDETLNMREILEEVGIVIPTTEDTDDPD